MCYLPAKENDDGEWNDGEQGTFLNSGLPFSGGSSATFWWARCVFLFIFVVIVVVRIALAPTRRPDQRRPAPCSLPAAPRRAASSTLPLRKQRGVNIMRDCKYSIREATFFVVFWVFWRFFFSLSLSCCHFSFSPSCHYLFLACCRKLQHGSELVLFFTGMLHIFSLSRWLGLQNIIEPETAMQIARWIHSALVMWTVAQLPIFL